MASYLGVDVRTYDAIISMTETEKKLNEAQFFLDALISSKKDPEKFNFFLSAFLSSSRSVSWVMRNEFSKVQEWQDWWDSKEPSSREQTLLRLFSELRNRSQKSKSVKTGFEITFDFKFKNEEDLNLVQKYFKSSPKGLLSFAVKKDEDQAVVQGDIEIKDGDGRKSITISHARVESVEPIFVASSYNLSSSLNVIKACKEYVSILTELVVEWLAIYSTIGSDFK